MLEIKEVRLGKKVLGKQRNRALLLSRVRVQSPTRTTAADYNSGRNLGNYTKHLVPVDSRLVSSRLFYSSSLSSRSLSDSLSLSLSLFSSPFPNSLLSRPTEKVLLKRLPAAPREARTITTSKNLPETLVPQAYDTYI